MAQGHFGYSEFRDSNTVARSKDGNLFMNGATLSDAAGKAILTLSGHAANIFSVDISPDNRFFLTSTCPKGGIPETKLWDSEGNELLTLAKFGGKIGFLPDGKAFYTYLSECCAECGYGEDVKIWPIDPQLLTSWVNKTSVHQLTKAEMDRFGIIPDLLPVKENSGQPEETAAAAPEIPKKQARITGSNVNVRSAPQVESGNVVGQLDEGMQVEVLDIKEEAAAENTMVTKKATTLRLADGAEIPLGNGIAVKRLSARESEAQYEVQVEIDGKPSQGMVPVADLQPMQGEKWYRVQSGDLSGWVYGRFVEEI